jgi:hypothetical protein
MWSFFNEYLTYIKAGLYVLAVCGIFYCGFHIGNSRYLAYKSEVEVAQKAQEAKVQAIQKEHELVTKGIQDEYDAKLALLRQYYANGVHTNGSSNMPGISTTSKITDATAAYSVLAGQCAETTLQLVELQKWINEQIGIK